MSTRLKLLVGKDVESSMLTYLSALSLPYLLRLGASLAVVGLNYLIYVVYSYLVNSLSTLPLVDVWTVPLLGLGIALIINSRKPKTI